MANRIYNTQNPLTALFNGQNRGPNTIKLRNAYNQYRINAEAEGGEDIMDFHAWAKQNHPDMRILEQ